MLFLAGIAIKTLPQKPTLRKQQLSVVPPAVAAAIRRAAQRRLLAIKQGSLWSLATMAGASHDALMESLEDSDGEEIVERGARFIDHARGFAKLLADFRDARGAGR